MFNAIVDQIKYSYNSGKVRPAITIFRKRKNGIGDMRVWNPLIVHFAGYNESRNINENKYHTNNPPQNTVGDQGNLEFTKVTHI